MIDLTKFIAYLLTHCMVLNIYVLSAAFKLNCSVDDSGLITIDCIEIDGEIASGQIYCVYDNGQRESCMPVITFKSVILVHGIIAHFQRVGMQ